MRLRFVMTCAANAYLSLFIQVVAARQLNDRCVYPTGLREEMARKYPGTRPIRWEDLDEYDRQYFQKGIGARCPGLLKVNFYGDGKPTWAVGLLKGAGSNRRVELVVARQLGKEWEMRSLLTLDGADSPVIMSQGPGEYRENPGGTTIQAKNPVIIFINWGSWAFTWIDGQVRKIMP